VADSGILLASVTSIKKSYNTLIGIDTGMNTLIRIPLYGAHHDILLSGHNISEPSGMFDVVGTGM